MKRYDFIIIGAGLFGTVMAEQLVGAGKSVLVIERRNHIGGNCYSYDYEDTGINLHQYGSHIFHTNSQEVWDYVSRFTGFNHYQHRVLTNYNGRVYTMPINLGTINAFYNVNLKPGEVEAFLVSKRSNIRNPGNFEEKAISLIGRDLYQAFIKGYTMKQWGCDPRELPASIIERLPVRNSYFDAYFDDIYQGIPLEGYTPVFKRLLKDIPVELNVDFLADKEYWRNRCKILVYTGPIDQYFGYCFGKLKWRSVRIEVEKLDIDDFQGASVVNYANIEIPFTRIHEPKHLHREKRPTSQTTVVMREYSQPDENEPYYPVNSEADQKLIARYKSLAETEKGVVFGGRLAEYQYYDMDDVISLALQKSQPMKSGN